MAEIKTYSSYKNNLSALQTYDIKKMRQSSTLYVKFEQKARLMQP